MNATQLNPAPEFMRKGEVRDLLRLKSDRTVNRYMRAGLKFIKVGMGRRATVLFRRADVIAFLDSQKGSAQ